VLVVASGWYYLLHTRAGAERVWRIAESATGGALSADRVAGSLSSGLTIAGLEFINDAVSLEIAEASVTLNVDLVPVSVTISDARVENVDLALPASSGDGGETDIGGILGALRLPLDIVFDDLVVRDIEVFRDEANAVIAADVASLRGRWSNELFVERLSVSATDVEFAAEGALALDSDHDLALSATVETGPGLMQIGSPLSVTADIDGNLDALTVDLQSADPAVSVTGAVTGLLDSPAIDLAIDVPALAWPPDDPVSVVAVKNAVAEISGNLQSFRLLADAGVEVRGLSPLQIALDGNGGPASFTADRFSARAGGGEISGDARLSWRDGPSVYANLDVASVRLAEWIDAWSGAHEVDGAVSVDLEPGRLVLRDSALLVRDGEVEIDLDARLEASGVPDDWRVSGSLGLGTPRFPSGRFTLEGLGDEDGIRFPALQGELLGGTIDGRGDFRWRDARAWTAEVSLAGIDTTELSADWPALVSGDVRASGQLQPLRVEAELIDIDGSLKARPLRAGGVIRVGTGEVSADAFSVSHGTSELVVDGSLYDEQGFSYRASIGDLGEYVTSLAGALELSGRASLNASQPYLRINARSDEVRYGNVTVNGLSLQDRATGDEVLDVKLETGTVRVGDYPLDSVGLEVDASRTVQTVNAYLDLDDATLSLGASGQLDSWENPSFWDGQLERLEFADDGMSGSLTKPANLDIYRAGVNTENVCVTGARRLDLCADVRWSAETGLDLAATLDALPLDLVNDFVETNLRFDQVISGELAWTQSASGVITGNANVSMTAGSVISLDRPNEPVRTDPGELKFDVVDNTLLSGVASLPIPGLGRLAAEFDMLDVSSGVDSEVRGLLDIDVPDLSAIDAVLPLVDSASGGLEADLMLSGSVAEPVVTGDMFVSDGGLTFLPIGLRLDEINISSQLLESGEVELGGSFRAGEGRATIQTRTDLAETATTGIEVTLSGENLSLINVDDVQAVADADVDIVVDNDVLSVNGQVSIPSARIRPRSIGVSRVSESDDVVIVAGELPQSEVVQEDKSDLRMMGTLDVAFGDDVEVELDIATARLTGETSFTWNGPLVPVANGRYDISGQVLAFGQRLEITEGGIRFPNVPADNPQIRLTALREIFGNSEVKQAGVLVSGTARRPDVVTFTIPYTTEERALTLLLTGSDFNYEAGVGAVDFGTYIAPKIYASYGIGLFDTENVIRVRYDLARGFGVTATSGQVDSGVDLTYRFEN
jgi:translocation and assembly module TamB